MDTGEVKIRLSSLMIKGILLKSTLFIIDMQFY